MFGMVTRTRFRLVGSMVVSLSCCRRHFAQTLKTADLNSASAGEVLLSQALPDEPHLWRTLSGRPD